VRTFQETTVFKEMSALENVVVAHQLDLTAGPLGIFLGSRPAREDAARIRESAAEILDYLGLGHVKDEKAVNLPHGYLRALGIAIAMAARPRLLLLDEPFAGMNPDETDRAMAMVEGIRKRGITVLLVEHDMRAVMKISDRIVVISFGSKIAEGKPEAIRADEAVIAAYLGEDDAELGH
jgi:branched-chain amino acid transport system ATP-binding protein